MITRRLILAGAAALAFTTSASAVAPICDALTLYGSAANSGLCKGLTMSNHWVCELSQNNPRRSSHLQRNDRAAHHGQTPELRGEIRPDGGLECRGSHSEAPERATLDDV